MPRRSATRISSESLQVLQLEGELRKAYDKLYTTRRAIVELMPKAIAERLRNFDGCQSEREFYDWTRSVIAFIIQEAVPITEASYFQPRGFCPLCHQGSSGPYDSGFTLPEGLRRHLEGFGNVRQCNVSQAAFALAGDSLAKRFAAADAEQLQRTRERREQELLILTHPNKVPMLRDELPGWRATARDDEEFQAAERELAELGFNRIVEGNVANYRMLQNGYLVLADPRARGRLDFIVLRDGDKARRPNCATFHMLDTWSKDRRGKFRSRLAAAVVELTDTASKRRSPQC